MLNSLLQPLSPIQQITFLQERYKEATETHSKLHEYWLNLHTDELSKEDEKILQEAAEILSRKQSEIFKEVQLLYSPAITLPKKTKCN